MRIDNERQCLKSKTDLSNFAFDEKIVSVVNPVGEIKRRVTTLNKVLKNLLKYFLNVISGTFKIFFNFFGNKHQDPSRFFQMFSKMKH